MSYHSTPRMKGQYVRRRRGDLMHEREDVAWPRRNDVSISSKG